MRARGGGYTLRRGVRRRILGRAEGMKAIVLTRGRIATVDDEDFDRVNQFKWYAIKDGRCWYAAHMTTRNRRRKVERLHMFIMGASGIDHRNNDGLDNRRQNLRAANKQQNGRAKQRKRASATSRYRGVSWYADRGKWTAQIQFGRLIPLGYFLNEVDTARAYDVAARKLFGEFAAPNFPA